MKIILNLYYKNRIVDAQLVRIKSTKKRHPPVAVDCTYLVDKILSKVKP